MLVEFGLVFIAAAWLSQLGSLLKKNPTKKISQVFIALYVIGVALLVTDNLSADLDILAGLNTAAMVVASLVFFKLK